LTVAGDRAVETFEHGLDLDRVVLFSDAVFAIAMTVLALSLHLPASTTRAGVAHALRVAIPSILVYFLSFTVIGRYWLLHHRYFRHIRRVDSTLLALNLAMLSMVAFLPFPTQVLGAYGHSSAAVVFYASSVSLLGALAFGLWAYASHGHRLLRPDTTDAFIRLSLWRGGAVATVFALSIPVALVNARAGEWCWLFVAVANLTLARFYGRLSDA
jgi:TMEM175 potassium channel family protein